MNTTGRAPLFLLSTCSDDRSYLSARYPRLSIHFLTVICPPGISQYYYHLHTTCVPPRCNLLLAARLGPPWILWRMQHPMCLCRSWPGGLPQWTLRIFDCRMMGCSGSVTLMRMTDYYKRKPCLSVRLQCHDAICSEATTHSQVGLL